MRAILFFISSIIIQSSTAQKMKMIASGMKTSLRGLSVVNKNVFWVSGSNGTLGKSYDGGTNIHWMKVEGYEMRDFRDIEAFDSLTAVIMAVSEPAVILKTKDGGQHWEKVFEDNRKGMFLDALDFYGDHGIVIGDPLDGKSFMAISRDRGDTWTTKLPNEFEKKLQSGEAFFAASGSNIVLTNEIDDVNPFVFVSGGMESKMYNLNQEWKLPLQSGKNSTGSNGLAVSPGNKYAVIVGGDFSNDHRNDSTVVVYNLKNKKQLHASAQLHGYRSGVDWIDRRRLISCGTSGIDVSNDKGETWENISTESFHVVKSIPGKRMAYLAGSIGKIALLTF